MLYRVLVVMQRICSSGLGLEDSGLWISTRFAFSILLACITGMLVLAIKWFLLRTICVVQTLLHAALLNRNLTDYSQD